ncbi:MAG: Uncharacterised protein [Polaribacter sejongensis]|jgi:hypothetical protein|nr:MAG: Uncharacterised protein [Polaribacter sejongensis]|tara:strand:+ start:2240 stop:2632 length:393 start_codon:yes stop_codon:yes gene_type:complete
MNLSRKSNIAFAVIAIIVITVFSVYKYSTKPPAEIEDRSVDFTGTSKELFRKVEENAALWQDKIVIISGEISSLDTKGFVLSQNIYCLLKDFSTLKTFTSKQNITLKGRVIGYDDLFEELKLDQCIIQKR